MSTVQDQLQKKIQQLEKQNAALRRGQEQQSELDSILCDFGGKKKKEKRSDSSYEIAQVRFFIELLYIYKCVRLGHIY